MRGSDSPQNTPLGHSNADKAKLAIALSQICALQKQYGKTEAELKTLVEGFCWVLSGYSMDEILHGLSRYVRRSNDIPSPADILNIIDPPPAKPQPLSGALYIQYQKMTREGKILLSDEREYCRAYEAQEHAKMRGGSEELREAQREIAAHGLKQLEYDY